ncbi:hypothetical protein C8B47_03705 [filamentous cyanobacterium CCP4]|nr:hypothetical protein C8B47_03705 [filamentous cyanobacterium CCP4]
MNLPKRVQTILNQIHKKIDEIESLTIEMSKFDNVPLGQGAEFYPLLSKREKLLNQTQDLKAQLADRLVEYSLSLRDKNYVTVSPETKERLIKEYGLNESHFVIKDSEV